MVSRFITTASASLLTVAGLAGCSSDTTTTATTDSSPSGSASAGCPITVADAWVKAADTGMTAAFGELDNTTAADVTITGASSPAATSMELHEVVEDNGSMVMQPVKGGFTVPANDHLHLEPGGYHLMLMDVTAPIKAGDDVTFTLTCSDGATTEFTAQAKTYTGAEEQYKGDGMESMDPMDSMAPSPSAP